MGSRTYRRDNAGRFAGAGNATTSTVGKAGGFANKAFASRVAAQRAAPGRSFGVGRTGVPSRTRTQRVARRAIKAGVAAGLGAAALAAARSRR